MWAFSTWPFFSSSFGLSGSTVVLQTSLLRMFDEVKTHNCWLLPSALPPSQVKQRFFWGSSAVGSAQLLFSLLLVIVYLFFFHVGWKVKKKVVVGYSFLISFFFSFRWYGIDGDVFFFFFCVMHWLCFVFLDVLSNGATERGNKTLTKRCVIFPSCWVWGWNWAISSVF